MGQNIEIYLLRNKKKADIVRYANLSTVLKLTGAVRDKYDKNKWRTCNGVISLSGTKFINWTQGIGGGGAIDLTMHLQGVGFKTAVVWLAENFPHHFIETSTDNKTISNQSFKPPKRNNTKLTQVTHYLINARSMPTTVINYLIDQGKLYADTRSNAVFLLLGKEKSIVGAELRGTFKLHWKGMAPGSKKNTGCFYVRNTNTTKIALCESAIDAISFFTLHQDFIAISTSGVTANPTWLSTLVAKGYQVFCGFDSDETGDAMAKKMIDTHPSVKRLRPSKKDWNDVLKSKSNTYKKL